MKVYICKKCKEASGDIDPKIEPCVLTVDDDNKYPIMCPYGAFDSNAKFKQVFPKLKKLAKEASRG